MYLFLKPASGSKNYHDFITCIGIGTRIVIGILMRYWSRIGIVVKFGIVPLLIIIVYDLMAFKERSIARE